MYSHISCDLSGINLTNICPGYLFVSLISSFIPELPQLLQFFISCHPVLISSAVNSLSPVEHGKGKEREPREGLGRGLGNCAGLIAKLKNVSLSFSAIRIRMSANVNVSLSNCHVHAWCV